MSAVEENELQPEPVPWTVRDAWQGAAFLGLWWVIIAATSLMIGLLELDINPGVFIGLAELALLLPVWWLTVRKYGVGWSALGLREFTGGMLGLGCGLMLLSFLFNIAYSTFLALFDLDVQVDLVPIFAELSSPWWLLVAGVVVAPIVEEIFFRGFIFAGLRRRYDWQKAALISSALFALIHLQLTAMIPIFILGYIFALLYHRSNSIVPAILMHILTNGLALGTAYLIANTDLPM
jgi:membrane protease YdiL (CAAX protease family)